MKKNNKGQITIFVILALIIVSALILFFIWVKPTYITPSTAIKPGIEGCMEQAVRSTIKNIETNDFGFPGLTFFYKYKGDRIPYLCYTNLYLQPCLNQKPFLVQHVSDELKKRAKDKIYACYDSFLDDLKSKGYQVSSGEKQIDIQLNPDKIVVELTAPITAEKESTQSFTKFKASFNSPLYNMLIFTTAIIQSETKYGDAVTDQFMILYPYIKLVKETTDDGNKIYTIEDKDTGDKIKFAVRSIAWPVGFGQDTGLVRRQ